MTSVELTALRERVRTDYPKLYNDLSSDSNLAEWQNFVSLLLNILDKKDEELQEKDRKCAALEEDVDYWRG